MIILIDKISVPVLATAAFVAATFLVAQSAAPSLGNLRHMASEGTRQIANWVSLSAPMLSDFMAGNKTIHTGI